jgi:hypothetical protein
LNIFTPRFIYRIITTQELVSFDFFICQPNLGRTILDPVVVDTCKR